ncbi:uncharacterized protein LOC134246013 [Saccostrea cucullata]|uniref:uncharacterized protein LOC134246013 n=1 Tax=Saccostrea cuccullata TaxID=36930 RepID=UPI002ED554E9
MTDTQGQGKAAPALPKIKKQSNKGGLRNVENNSRDAQEVKLTIERSNLDLTYASPWSPKTIQMVVNKELESQYREKKTAMKEEGRPARELQDHFAFILVKDPKIMTKIAQEGVKTKQIAFNALGNSKLGIYVCKHADVQLKLAESWRVDQCHLIVCKVMYGKCKLVTPQTGTEIEPTPNFDCHVSQEKPNPNDSFSLQIIKSMVYMYEYNEDYETVDRPKHCVPYAFVVYEKSRDKRLSSDTKPIQWASKPKPSASSRPSSGGNEALRKSNREAFEKRVAGLYNAPPFPHLYIPPVENRMTSQQGLLPLPILRPSIYSVHQTRQDPRVRSSSQDDESSLTKSVEESTATTKLVEESTAASKSVKPEQVISPSKTVEEIDTVPYSPGKDHEESGEESYVDTIPTPERELEESIIKASFRKDTHPPEQSTEEKVDLSMLNANSDQLEAVVKHLEAVLKKKQEELLIKEGMVQDEKNYESQYEIEEISQMQDVDERIVGSAEESFVVNEMGDIDERVRSTSNMQDDAWNTNFANAFGFDPRNIPFKKSVKDLPEEEKDNKHSTDIIKEVPMDIDSDNESNPIKSASPPQSKDDSPQKEKTGRKVSLSDYKARRKQTSPIRPKVNETVGRPEILRNKTYQGKEVNSLSSQTPTSTYSQYLTEEQARYFQHSYSHQQNRTMEMGHLKFPPTAHFPNTSSSQLTDIQNSQMLGQLSSNLQITNSSLQSPTASRSPGSAGSSHFGGFFQRSPTGLSPGASSNQPIGSILHKVNVDISNIKNILQSIASPTTSPTVSPEKNIWSSAHEDVPWMQLKDVQRQLSFEEKQAELRYDAYNLTSSKPEKPVEDDDDSDFTSLISKIKNLQQEIDQIKKDEKSKGTEWPSPLKAVKELVDKKLEGSKQEIPSVSRGANLLQDLSYFEEEKKEEKEKPKKETEVIDLSGDGVNIPGFGFSEESPGKKFQTPPERIEIPKEPETIDLCDDDLQDDEISLKRSQEEPLSLSDNHDSDDNCLVICDHSPGKIDESTAPKTNPSLLGFYKDTLMDDDKVMKDVKESCLQTEENIHIFQMPKAVPTTTKNSKNNGVEINLENDKEIGYISCEGSYTSENDNSPVKQKSTSTKKVTEDGRKTPEDLGSRQQENSKELHSKETPSKLSTVSSSTDLSVRRSPSDMSSSDESKRKAQRAKMKAYLLKKKRGMIGYTKKRKRKKKHAELDDLISTTSSDLLDVSESLSLDRFSGALSSKSRMSSPLDSVQKLNPNTLLADLGVKHWTDGLKVKELQPVVYLRRCDDPKSLTSNQPLTRIQLESQSSEILPDVDSRFPQHKDDRVKEWIEGTRKKIKLTLKDQKENEMEKAQNIPVFHTSERKLSIPVSAKPEPKKLDDVNFNEKKEIKQQILQPSQIKKEPCLKSDAVSMTVTGVKIENKPTQGQVRNISPITVICSKPPIIAQTRVPSPVVTCVQSANISFKPISVTSGQQLAAAKQDLFTPRVVRLSSSAPSQQNLVIPTIRSEPVPPQSTTNLVTSSFTNLPQQAPHLSANQMTLISTYNSYLANPSGLTGSYPVINPVSATPQRPPAAQPSSCNQQGSAVQSSSSPYLSAVPLHSGVPSAVSQGQSAVVNTNPALKNVSQGNAHIGGNIPVHPQNAHVPPNEQMHQSSLVQVPKTYGINPNFPPPYRYTSAAQQPYPIQRFQTPVTQSVFQGSYHPSQSPIQSIQRPNLQRPLYTNQPHQQQMNQRATFQPVHQGMADNQRVPPRPALQVVTPPTTPLSQVLPPQPIPQNPSSYPKLPFGQVPAPPSSTLNDTTAAKRKSTDVMDWFVEKFVAKKHVKESGSSSYTDTYSDTDSKNSRRSRSRSPTDSYTESSLSPSPRKKRSDSFLVYGCQQGAGRNESNTKMMDGSALSSQIKDMSPERVKYSPVIDGKQHSPDWRRPSFEKQNSSENRGSQVVNNMNLKDRVEKSPTKIDHPSRPVKGPSIEEKPKPTFRNTFRQVTNDVLQSEQEIADAPASPDTDTRNVTFETPASPEQETPASPDHNVSEIPQISYEIIELGESPERPTDDEKMDLFDTSIDKLDRKREAIRRQLDDLRSDSNSPRVIRNVELKSNDLIEISDEELEEGEIADESKRKESGSDNDRRIVAVHGTEDSKDKILSKYHEGLSVTVNAKGKSDLGGKTKTMKTEYDANNSERMDEKDNNWSSDDSDREMDRKSRSDRYGYRYRSSRRDPYSRKSHEHRSRFRSRGRSSSSDRRYRSHRRSSSSKKRYTSRGRSSSSERRYRSRNRSSSSERRYKSRGRSSSSERRYKSRGRSSSSERRYKSRGRSSSRDKHEKYKRSNKYKEYGSDSSEGATKKKNNRDVSKDYVTDRALPSQSESLNKNEKPQTDKVPYERKFSVSTAANAWSEMLRQKPTNIEVIKGDRKDKDVPIPTQDDLNVYKELKEYITNKKLEAISTIQSGNGQTNVSDQAKETKGFVRVIQNMTPKETFKSWAIKEFKFNTESEFDEIASKITVNLNLEITQLSKCQRKATKAKLRKEVEIAMESLRIERLGANQSFPASSAESVVKNDRNALQIRPFEPLNIMKNSIEKELEIVRDHLKKLWHSTQVLIDAVHPTHVGSKGAPKSDKSAHLFSIRQDMQQIETDLVQRTATYGAHYGVVNRRVPNELLTDEEKNSHFSEESLVLVLSGYIPSKAFQKLTALREKLENAKKDIAKAESLQNKEQLVRLRMGKEEIHRARKAMMLSFTGPLSKKRIQKIKTKAKCYRNCVDYFKKELGEFDAETHLRYLMISLQDLDKHFSLLTQLQEEQEKQKQEEINQDIHLKKRRVMVNKFHDNFRFVDNQLNSMFAKYQFTNPHVLPAITDVSRKIKEALVLIDAEKDSKNISVNTVAQLEQILKSCLTGYENVKQQIVGLEVSIRSH